MSQEVELERQLKKAAKTGKYVVGRREVMSAVKGSKFLVWSDSADVPQKILDDCQSFSIPALKFNGNPVELGRACGIPFRVSVIAIKSVGDANFETFGNSVDYGTALHTTVKTEVVKESEDDETSKEKPKTVRKRKTKETSEPEKKPAKKTAVKKATQKRKTNDKKEKS